MRGGFRPNSGPQKGSKYKPRSPKPMEETKTAITPKKKALPKVKVKKELPPKIEPVKEVKAVSPAPLPEKSPVLPLEDAIQAEQENLTPLEYLLREMNDPSVDKNRRDKLAALAAPFCHPRAGESKGKKKDKENAAKEAGKGKFAPGVAPLSVVK